MPIVNGMNNDYINYFSLFDYVNQIKLSTRVLKHLENTNREFDNYMHTLSCYDEEYIVNYWIYLLYEEISIPFLLVVASIFVELQRRRSFGRTTFRSCSVISRSHSHG